MLHDSVPPEFRKKLHCRVGQQGLRACGPDNLQPSLQYQCGKMRVPTALYLAVWLVLLDDWLNCVTGALPRPSRVQRSMRFARGKSGFLEEERKDGGQDDRGDSGAAAFFEGNERQ